MKGLLQFRRRGTGILQADASWGWGGRKADLPMVVGLFLLTVGRDYNPPPPL